jgi:hypothetical protein
MIEYSSKVVEINNQASPHIRATNTGGAVHNLKTWPEPFNAVCNGQKTHEVRKNDRDFKVGDILHLYEWNPETKEYTGLWTDVRVNYISEGGTFGLPTNLCVMSIGPVTR